MTRPWACDFCCVLHLEFFPIFSRESTEVLTNPSKHQCFELTSRVQIDSQQVKMQAFAGANHAVRHEVHQSDVDWPLLELGACLPTTSLMLRFSLTKEPNNLPVYLCH